MAEEKKEEKKEQEKKSFREDKKEKEFSKMKSIVRILSSDISGEKSICYGLIKIKGVSHSFASALCNTLKLDKKRKISSLSPEEIKTITDFIQKPKLPLFVVNRRNDLETGEDKHLSTTALELQHGFDIRRLRKIRSYKGSRHAKGLPVRGQRTRAHFRKGKSVGVVRRKQQPSKSKKKK